MKIGIFGGAFNPVHNGHLFLLEQLAQFNQIDKLLIIPTANPPHKTGNNLAAAADRMNMLSLAVENAVSFKNGITDIIEISDIEFKLGGKSYTYNTLCELKKKYADDELFLFMGSDQFLAFKEWYRYSDILKLANVVAIAREVGEQEKLSRFLEENKDEFKHNASVFFTRPMIVSSTDIRSKVKNKQSISGLVPKEVENYIIEKELYSV